MLQFIRPRAVMETILLVDDSPLRASLRKSVLESGAPAVVRAIDAAEALCMVESPDFADSLALVVTGHTMSGISGPEFVAEFRSRIPRVPVLVLSSIPGAEREYQSIPQVYYSQASSPDELRSTVKRLLGSDQKQSA